MVQVASGGVSNQIWWWHGDQTLVCWPALEDARELTLEAQPAYLSLYRPPGEGGTLIPIPGPRLGRNKLYGRYRRVERFSRGPSSWPRSRSSRRAGAARRSPLPRLCSIGRWTWRKSERSWSACLLSYRQAQGARDRRQRERASPMKRRRPPPACPCILLRSAKKCEPA